MENLGRTEALLEEIRDLLVVIAEPRLAERDKKLRDELKRIGGGEKKQAAILAIADGADRKLVLTRSGIDNSALTKLLKELDAAGALDSRNGALKLRCRIPQDFFTEGRKEKVSVK